VDVFQKDFATKIRCDFLVFSVLAIFPTHRNIVDVTILIILGDLCKSLSSSLLLSNGDSFESPAVIWEGKGELLS